LLLWQLLLVQAVHTVDCCVLKLNWLLNDIVSYLRCRCRPP
jgi:hypothetical protein